MAKEASLDDCLKLLHGDSDEQRLVGLLLATKFVKGDDIEAVRKLFNGIGFQFVNRLIITGSGQEGRGRDIKKQGYLHLALSVLAAFCRLPELAASDETIVNVPVIVATLGSKQDEAAAADCYECLLAVAVSSERGMQTVMDSRALPVVCSQLQHSPPEAPWIPVALKLLHALMVKAAADSRIPEYSHDLTSAVTQVAAQLCRRQDTSKFEALSILYSLLVSDISDNLKGAVGATLRSSQWPADARTGLGQILHSRVAVEQKHLALELAGSIVQIVGDSWLVGAMDLPEKQGRLSPDRFFLLIVETLRVETSVLFNEVAANAFDPREGADAESSQAAEGTTWQQRRLMNCFNLLEYVINVVATQEESSNTVDGVVADAIRLDEVTLQRTVVALDEIVGVALEFLEDAQEHHQNEGHVLLASVRMVSRYLAEAPSAHRQRCVILLPYLLSVTSDQKTRPFFAVQFMLPFLTQMTLEFNGCEDLLASGSHKQVLSFMSWAVEDKARLREMKSSLMDLCDILLNLLAKNNDQLAIDEGSTPEFIPLIPTLLRWYHRERGHMERLLVTSVLASLLALTDEDQFENCPELGFDSTYLPKATSVIITGVRDSLEAFESGETTGDVEDLYEIILSGSKSSINRHPSFKLKLREELQRLMEKRGSRHRSDLTTNPNLRQLLDMAFES